MNYRTNPVSLSILVLAFAVAAAASAADISSHFGEVFSDGPRTRRAVALTFDDGPSDTTPKLLDLLKREKVRATFFQEGSQVEKYPQYARRVVEEGHLIANHSWDHPNFWFYQGEDKKEKLGWQIKATRDAIQKATGVDVVYMRMPHGFIGDWRDERGKKVKPKTPGAHYDAWTKEVAKKQKVILVNWTYGSDWTNISKERMLKGYLAALRPGAILLFHDGEGDRSKMMWIVPRVIAELRKKNLEPLRVDELLKNALD